MTDDMRLHLFSTDASVFELVKLLPAENEVVAVVVPGNRLHTAKVVALRLASSIPTHVHAQRRPLPPTLSSADAAIVWLYTQVIDAADLRRYPSGLLNMHGGKIPEYRGQNVLNWAIANGETELGITWHSLVEEIDAGPIYAESTIPIGETDTVSKMRPKMLAEGLRLFPEAWSRFSGGGKPVRVPELSGGRVWPRWKPSNEC